ncbi:hypothetical protein R3P38DRAFT_2578349 [Favolaschia claudopus]|uniref:NAD(P)-binding protein n=1 Tax=Favolaschia claudopus TaxID=2862362 RepID=A0AAV9ZH10_9AGAR
MHRPDKFNPARDIPDLSGKVIIVTGGNSGIGYETVKALLSKNAKVYLAARSKSKAIPAIEQLYTETGKRAEFLALDLADSKSVREAAEEFLSKEQKLDILFNNGGVMVPPTDQLTRQGYDLQFGTNVLGHFFLTELLLPALSASHAHTSLPARIINTSSDLYTSAPKRDIFFEALKDGTERDARLKKWGRRAPWTLYGASKAGNIFVANHYAKAYPGVLVSCALHPGIVQTGLQRNMPAIVRAAASLMFTSPAVGAYTQLWAGTTATAQDMNGKYFEPVAVEKAVKGAAGDKELEDEVIKYLKHAIEGF